MEFQGFVDCPGMLHVDLLVRLESGPIDFDGVANGCCSGVFNIAVVCCGDCAKSN